MLTACAAAAAPPRNLVPNSSAEWLGGAEGMPECWSVWKSNSGEVEVTVDATVARFGRHSLKVVNHGRGGANTTILGIPCRGGATYTLSVYVKTQDSRDVTVTLGAKDGEGKVLTWGLGGSKPVPGTTDWLRVVHTVTTPADCRALVPHLTNKGGVSWWDGCQIETGDRATDYVDSTPPSLPTAAEIRPGTNLAPNPGFEEAAGWRARTASADPTGLADWATDRSHGGRRSIHLARVTKTRRWESDVIPIDAKATYRLSAWLLASKLEGRADVYLECYGRWRLPIGRAGYNGGVYAYTDFGWGERYAVIRPDQFPPGTHYARIVCQVQGTIHAKGEAWVDDVALVMQPCTQTLRPVRSSDAMAQSLFRPDEPVRFEMTAHAPGLPGRALTARLSLRDYFGRNLLERNAPFTCDARADATVALDLPPMRACGQFVLTVEVADGDRSLGSERASFGVTTFDAAAWRSDERSGFGICHVRDDRLHRLARIAGMKWQRGHPNPSWRQVEREQGKWNWTPFQRWVDHARPFGLHKLVILSGIPHWASQGPDEFFVFFRSLANKRYKRLPKDIADFENYVYQTVSRFKDAIRCWEIWNEADIAFWHGTDEEYIQLMQAAYRGAKRADKTCRVSMTGLAYPFPHKSRTGRQVDGRLFLEKCLRLAKDEFDIINFHSYGGVKPLERKLHEIAALQKQFGANKPVWLTETGMPTHLKGSSEEQQAQYVLQGHALAFANGVDKVFWHCFYDWGVDPNYHEHHFGLVRHDYSPKPAFMAYCAMTRMLAGAEAKGEVAVAPGVRAVAFQRGAQPITVLWSEAESQTILVRLDRDSYRLTDMMGNGRPCAAPMHLARLELTRNAVYLGGARIASEVEQPVSVEPKVLLRPGESRAVRFTVRNPVDAAISGSCAFTMPAGWRVEPASVKLALEKGQSQTASLMVTAPSDLNCGRADLTCRLQLGSLDLGGLTAGGVTLAAPVDSQPGVVHIDGDLAEWRARPAIELDPQRHAANGAADGPKDLSARLWLAADARALYVAVDVCDDWVGNHRRYDSPWIGDAVELFLDLRQGDSLGSARYAPGVHQIFLIPPDRLTPTATWRAWRPESPFSSTLDLVGRRTERGYALEARLPWDAFGPYRPRAGQAIGIDLAIDDVDGPGATTREAQLIWAGGARNFVDASLFGRAILSANPAAIRASLPERPGNLLPNPGFEADINADQVFDHRDGWKPTRADWNDTTGAWRWDSDVAHTGKRCLAISRVTTHRTWESAPVPVSNETAYRASAWIRTDGLGKGAARIYVACYSAQGKWTGTVARSADVTGTSDWRRVEVLVPAGKLPADTAVVRVDLSLRQAPEGVAWFDDVELRALRD